MRRGRWRGGGAGERRADEDGEGADARERVRRLAQHDDAAEPREAELGEREDGGAARLQAAVAEGEKQLPREDRQAVQRDERRGWTGDAALTADAAHGRLVAGVHGAVDAVVQGRGLSGDAAGGRLAGLDAVAQVPIWTRCAILRHKITGSSGRITDGLNARRGHP